MITEYSGHGAPEILRDHETVPRNHAPKSRSMYAERHWAMGYKGAGSPATAGQARNCRPSWPTCRPSRDVPAKPADDEALAAVWLPFAPRNGIDHCSGLTSRP